MRSDRATLAPGLLAAEGEPFVLITVIKAQGSTHCNPGARKNWLAKFDEDAISKQLSDFIDSLRKANV